MHLYTNIKNYDSCIKIYPQPLRKCIGICLDSIWMCMRQSSVMRWPWILAHENPWQYFALTTRAVSFSFYFIFIIFHSNLFFFSTRVPPFFPPFELVNDCKSIDNDVFDHHHQRSLGIFKCFEEYKNKKGRTTKSLLHIKRFMNIGMYFECRQSLIYNLVQVARVTGSGDILG